MSTLSLREPQHVGTTLASPALIRLITEIDDHGPIPPGALSRTIPDLTVHHLRQATTHARALDLVRHRPGVGLDLTASGTALADLYDAAARWARRHSFPAPVADFTLRIQHTLDLLLHSPADPTPNTADPIRPRELLNQWLASATTPARRSTEPSYAQGRRPDHSPRRHT